MDKLKASALSLIIVSFSFLLFACGGGGSNSPGQTELNLNDKTVTSISIKTSDESISTGGNTQLFIVVTYDDNSTETIDQNVDWSVSDQSLASIDANGNVTAKEYISSVDVLATYSGQTAMLPLEINHNYDAYILSLTIDPNVDLTSVENQSQLTGTATFSDGSISTDYAITVNVIPAQTAGETDTLETEIGSNTFRISNNSNTLTLTPTAPIVVPVVLLQLYVELPSVTLASGKTIQASAFGDYSDGQTHVPLPASNILWETNSPALTIDNSGIVTAGTVTQNTLTTLQGSLDGKSAFVDLTITPETPPITTATLDEITIHLSAANVTEGNTITASATGNYSDGSTNVTLNDVVWSTTSASISISETGNITTQDISQDTSVTITAKLEGIEATKSFTVIALTTPAATLTGISLSVSTNIIRAGETSSVTVTANYDDNSSVDVTNSLNDLSSDSPALVVNGGSISGGDQSATGLITANYNGFSASESVQFIQPDEIRITVSTDFLDINKNIPLSLFALYDTGENFNISNYANWTIGNNTIADISNSILNTKSAGSTSLSANAFGLSVSQSVNVSNITPIVVSTIEFEEPSILMFANKIYAPTVFGVDSNGNKQILTSGVQLTVVDTNVATVDENGFVTSADVSTYADTRIVATYGDKVAEGRVYVSALNSVDYLVYQVDGGQEITRGEFNNLTTSDLKVSFNTTGVVSSIANRTPYPNQYFFTHESIATNDQLLLALNSNSPGSYDKTNAALHYIANKQSNVTYILDDTSNTSLTVNLLTYASVGSKAKVEFTATLCQANIENDNGCASNSTLKTITGVFEASIENQLPSACYPSTNAKTIDAYTAHSFQNICMDELSYYSLETQNGLTYEVIATSLGANVNVTTIGESTEKLGTDFRGIEFTATSSETTIIFNHIGTDLNHAFKLDVNTLSIQSEGSQNSPVLIEHPPFPYSVLLSVNGTDSFYKVSVANGYTYAFGFKNINKAPDNSVPLTSTIAISNASDFSDAAPCGKTSTSAASCSKLATGDFFYIQVSNDTIDGEIINAQMTFETEIGVELDVPKFDYLGQVAGGTVYGGGTGPTGSQYWVLGTNLNAGTSYTVQLTNIVGHVLLYINNQPGGLEGECSMLSGENTEISCIVTTKSFGTPFGFPINILPDGSDARYLLSVFETP